MRMMIEPQVVALAVQRADAAAYARRRIIEASSS